MATREDSANVGAGTGGRDTRPSPFTSGFAAPKTPARAGGGRSSFEPPSPVRAGKTADPLAGFDRSTLTKLTPFAMPKPPEPEQVEWEPNQGVGTWALRSTDTPPDPQRGGSGTWSLDNGLPEKARQQERSDEKPKPTYGKERTRRTVALSWEDYQKLSKDQRAAVDFNTLLVKAREKDLNTSYDPSAAQQADYDKAVQRMFGADGGSETYAPETVAVLRQIDYKDTEEDLDNFLGLKTAITARELKDFSFDDLAPVTPPQVDTYDAKRALGLPLPAAGPEQPLAENTAALQESMAKAGQLLQSFQKSAALQRNADLQFFGGTMNEPGKIAFGFGDDRPGTDVEGIDSYFKEAYNALALKDNDANLGVIFSKIEEKLSPQQMQAFNTYVDLRTQQAVQHGAPLADVEGNVRSPQEFRKLFGLDTIGEKTNG